jgi:uncharacterized protein involved in outer membrane biogenesis
MGKKGNKVAMLAQKPQATHFAIKQVCEEMAGVFYEGAAHDNQFYKFYPNQSDFIKREWWRFIATAKESLWGILRGEADASMRARGMSESEIEKTKQDTFDVLSKEGTLPKSGKMVSMAQYAGIPADHA